MRKISAVTTCHDKGYAAYGRDMIQSFDQHVPTDVSLLIYTENFEPELMSTRLIYRDLHASCPELVAFKQRHKNNPLAHGGGRKKFKFKMNLKKPSIKIKRVKVLNGYQWDAVRFSHKMFSIFNAAKLCDSDILIWLDADIFIFRDIPKNFLDPLLPGNCLVSYLARPNYYSECGFVGYNLRHPAIWDFLREFEDYYRKDSIFKLPEFHDSYVFDVVRRHFEQQGCQTYDLSQGVGTIADHVFVNSQLGQYMDHKKGERKLSGKSHPSDFVVDRNEQYWRDANKPVACDTTANDEAN